MPASTSLPYSASPSLREDQAQLGVPHSPGSRELPISSQVSKTEMTDPDLGFTQPVTETGSEIKQSALEAEMRSVNTQEYIPEGRPQNPSAGEAGQTEVSDQRLVENRTISLPNTDSAVSLAPMVGSPSISAGNGQKPGGLTKGLSGDPDHPADSKITAAPQSENSLDSESSSNQKPGQFQETKDFSAGFQPVNPGSGSGLQQSQEIQGKTGPLESATIETVSSIQADIPRDQALPGRPRPLMTPAPVIQPKQRTDAQIRIGTVTVIVEAASKPAPGVRQEIPDSSSRNFLRSL